MTKDEALRLALEALKTIDEAMPFPVAKLAIKECKAALEAKDEPVAWMRTSGTGSPVVTEELLVAMPEMRWNFQQPLYTTPPQRTWVGLTDEEMKDALISVDPATKRLPIGFARFGRAIEAKLCEKNAA